jgi:enoyl-[acyl-carrier protein] reductase/trans-2-enoyl-CoA reductase (NAD+)
MAAEVVSPRIRGFICVNAHPEGCAAAVRRQIAIARAGLEPEPGARNALIVGASTGYGLATRIAAAFGLGMRTTGVFFERPPSNKTATAGWYNSAAFHREAAAAGLYSANFNGDAFAHETKQQVLDRIKRELGPIHVLVYSLASPVRVHPDTGVTHRSALKPVGRPFVTKTIDLAKQIVTEITIEPASAEELEGTIAVMGGDDLRLWVEALLDRGLLAEGARVVAYSYIGPELTWPIYHSGTIGRAKADLERVCRTLDRELREQLGGGAWVSVNKAVVTQASSAIPVVPLYLSILLRVLGTDGLDEQPIDQMVRLLRDHLGAGSTPVLDAEGRIRLDDRELQPRIQAEVLERWNRVTTATLERETSFDQFQREFRRLFGFELEEVDYEAPVEIEVPLPE